MCWWRGATAQAPSLTQTVCRICAISLIEVRTRLFWPKSDGTLIWEGSESSPASECKDELVVYLLYFIKDLFLRRKCDLSS